MAVFSNVLALCYSPAQEQYRGGTPVGNHVNDEQDRCEHILNGENVQIQVGHDDVEQGGNLCKNE